MVEILISVAAKVAEYMVDPICRHLSYLFNHHRHVESLIQKIGEVEGVRDRLGNLVDNARRQGDIINSHVEEWLQEAEGIIQKKEGFVEGERQASKSCFYLKSRHHLSEKAEKQAVYIDAKLQQACQFGDTVARRPSPPLISSENCEAFPSRRPIFDQIMEALRNKETSMVGVRGMGGVGKTTLALQVAERAEKEKLFHKVVIASSISQTPNISEIQKEIAKYLGLNLREDEDKALRLHTSLKNEETVLVILDDIWGKLELAKIGIPYGHEHKGCKLLLTSRDQQVLDSDMGAEQVFHLQHLNAKEAWNLFKRRAGDSVESPEIRSIAKEIVEHCEGLPIALVTIGNALQKKGAPVWNNALEELKNAAPTNLRGVSKKVYSCLELSYNHLEGGEAKSLFLLCGLLEDAHISMDRLLLYCTGLDLFERLYSWEKAINKVITLVESLKASSLLLDPDQDGNKGGYGSMFFDVAFVKMHDVVRDVARSIASRANHQYVVRAAAELRGWEMRTDECRSYCRISLECGHMNEPLPQRLACPKLELLLLNSRFNQAKDMRIPDAFFQGITNLRVLHLTGVSLGPSLVFPSNLRVLCLNDCQPYDLSWIEIGELKSLHALSLAGSKIEKLPKEMMQLSGLRVLDLRDCRGLRIIPREVISSLSGLEYLSLKGCDSIEWERDGVGSGERNNACLSELKHLPKLKTLEVEVSDPGLLPEDEMLFHNVSLTIFSIAIGRKLRYNNYDGRVSRILQVERSVPAVLKCLSKLFWSCQILALRKLVDIKEVVHELDRDHGFAELKSLSIRDCPAIEYMLHSRDHQWVLPCNTLSMLEKLNLWDLDSLEAVCRGPIPVGYFRNLRFLRLRDCKRLKYVFSSQDPTMELAFPHLQSLELSMLPELISFSSSTTTTIAGSQDTIAIFNRQDSFPALESISVGRLDSVTTLWYSPQISADFFLRLQELEVKSCRKLLNVFPLSVAKALGQLQRLLIESCEAVEEIVTSHEDETPDSLSLFPNLTDLTLRDLPQLKKFCSKRLAIRWPRVKSLQLWRCHMVEILFVQETGVEGGGLATTEIQQPFFFLQKDAFPALEYIYIELLDSLRALWYNHQISADFFSRLRGLKDSFPAFESIFVEGLDSLRALWYSPQISVDFFLRLKKLGVDSCCKLQNIFPLSVAKTLGQLQELLIQSCEAVEEIVTSHEDDTAASLALFPNLTSLALKHLPQLKKFCSKRFASRWPLLKSLELEGCDKVEILFVQETGVEGGGLATTEIQQPFFLQKDPFPNLEQLKIIDLKGVVEIWRGQFSGVSFSKLRDLIIEGCNCISVMIIPMNVARALHNLKTLRMVKCGSLNEIIQVVDGEQPPTDAEIDFPKLKKLKLEYLPNLKSFCSMTCTFRFPFLRHIVVKGCYKMEFFCQGDLQTPRLKYEKMERPLKQYWETNLNTTVRLIKQAHLQGTIEEDEEEEDEKDEEYDEQD